MSRRYEAVFVDLDRTIFDTSTFFTEVWDTVGRLRSVDTTLPRARASQYYVYHGDLYTYEFFRHLQAEGIDVTEGELIDELRAENRFIYPDVMPAWPALADIAEPQLLTYGGAEYQRLKIACCPELDHVPVVNVLEPKAAFFEREMPGRPVLLLDDKDLAAELPSSVDFIRVWRNDDASITRGHGQVTINSFEHLKEALVLL